MLLRTEVAFARYSTGMVQVLVTQLEEAPAKVLAMSVLVPIPARHPALVPRPVLQRMSARVPRPAKIQESLALDPARMQEA